MTMRVGDYTVPEESFNRPVTTISGPPSQQPDSITLTPEQIQMMIQMGVSTALNKVVPKHGREDQGTGSKAVGDAVRAARDALNFSQEDLAVRSGVHRSTIGKIETAARGMSLETFSKLYYGISHAKDDDPHDNTGVNTASVFRVKIMRHYAGVDE